VVPGDNVRIVETKTGETIVADLREATAVMAQEIGRVLNDGQPVIAHKIGFILVTFQYGPAQPANYASNCDPTTLANVLTAVVGDIRTRTNVAALEKPQAIIVPPSP